MEIELLWLQSQRRDPTAIYGTVETENIYSTLNDGHYEVVNYLELWKM